MIGQLIRQDPILFHQDQAVRGHTPGKQGGRDRAGTRAEFHGQSGTVIDLRGHGVDQSVAAGQHRADLQRIA